LNIVDKYIKWVFMFFQNIMFVIAGDDMVSTAIVDL